MNIAEQFQNPIRVSPIIYLFVICFLVSCSHHQKNDNNLHLNTVKLESQDSSVKIAEESTNVFGPRISDPDNFTTEQRQELWPKVGLILGPGLYMSSCHIGIIKNLLNNNIPISLIGGVEWGALIGAFLAEKKQYQWLEWSFFKLKQFIEEREGTRVVELTREVSDKLFSKRLISNLSFPFLISSENSLNEYKQEYWNQTVSSAINSHVVNLLGVEHASEINFEQYPSIFKKFGANFIVYVDVLGDKTSFYQKTNKIYETSYKTLIKSAHILKELADYTIDLDLDSIELDNIKQTASLIKECENLSYKKVINLKNFLKSSTARKKN